jgi:hypothetical protein
MKSALIDDLQQSSADLERRSNSSSGNSFADQSEESDNPWTIWFKEKAIQNRMKKEEELKQSQS